MKLEEEVGEAAGLSALSQIQSHMRLLWRLDQMVWLLSLMRQWVLIPLQFGLLGRASKEGGRVGEDRDCDE